MSAWPIEPSVAIPAVIAATMYNTRLGSAATARAAALRTPSRLRCFGRAGDVGARARVAGRRATHRWLSPTWCSTCCSWWSSAHAVDGGAGGFRCSWACPARSAGWCSHDEAPVGRRLTRWLLHPSVGWIAFALAFWVWHAPAALRSRSRLRPLASRRARLLPRERAALLATRDPPPGRRR